LPKSVQEIVGILITRYSSVRARRFTLSMFLAAPALQGDVPDFRDNYNVGRDGQSTMDEPPTLLSFRRSGTTLTTAKAMVVTEDLQESSDAAAIGMSVTMDQNKKPTCIGNLITGH